MAKGKAHRHVEFVIVPIAYIQALSVGHPVAAGGELAVAGRVFHGVGEALGQLAAGAALPSEQMGAGLCGALACQIQVENGTHPGRKGHIIGCAAKGHKDDVWIDRGDLFY